MTDHPKMVIERGFFENKDEVMRDILKTGFWPTTLASPPTEELPLHSHDCEIHGYVISGHTYVLVGREGRRIEIGPGDKLVLPPGSIHAEGSSDEEVTYTIVGEDEADVSEGRISISSPIARALLGKAVDDSVVVRVPKGTREFEVREIRVD